MSLDSDAYVYCVVCGAQFDLSDFSLPFMPDHGDYVDGDCPDCSRDDTLVIQG